MRHTKPVEQGDNIANLAALPLHTLTEQYGEAGLWQRFELEVERFAPDQQSELMLAGRLATELHRDSRRSQEPYNNHVLRVGIRVMSPDHLAVDDIDIIIAALLHDAVEDHAPALAERSGLRDADQNLAALHYITQTFNPRVARVIAAVTNPDFDYGSDWQAAYRQHVQRSLLEVPEARVVKLSDFIDNGVGVEYSRSDRIPYFAAKYAPLIPMFRQMIMLPDTPLSPNAKQRILIQLERAERRLAAILGKPGEA